MSQPVAPTMIWTRRCFGALALASALALVAVPSLAGAQDLAEQAQRARHYVETFFGDDAADAIQPFLDGTMKTAMSDAQVEQLRSALERQLGAVEKFGEPWHEGVTQGYDRFRVPVHFEKSTMDLRVVLDQQQLVAGMFVVPHIEPPSDDAEAPAPPGTERDIEVGELPGVLLLPDGDGPFAGVVLVHGSGPNDRDETIGPNKPFRDLAWGLAERGIASLRYDKRSLALPETLMSLGDALTVEHEVIDDARKALRVLADTPEIDAGRLYVIGHSLGGTLAPRVASAEVSVEGIVVLAGATLPLPEKMIEQTGYIVGHRDQEFGDAEKAQIQTLKEQADTLRRALDGTIEPPEGNLLGAPVGYFADLEAHPSAELAASLGLPVLVLQGERDYQVTMRDFALWQEALRGKSFACLETYPALDHLFHEGEGPSTPSDYERRAVVSPQVIDDIASWIESGRCP